jgi:hypothetical protein
MTKAKFLAYFLTPFLVFLLSSGGSALFLSQQGGHILWENLVASSLFGATIAFFSIFCLLSKWVFPFWLIETLFLGIVFYFAGYGPLSFGPCPVSFYCTSHSQYPWLVFGIQTGFESIFLFDIVFGYTIMFRILMYLNAVFPQTPYYLGAFLMSFFALMINLVQRIPGIPEFSGFQYLVMSLMGLLGLASFLFGIFYKKLSSKINRFKRIYGASIVAFIFLLPFLAPLEASPPEDQKIELFGKVFFASLALFSFIYFGFFGKKRLQEKTKLNT